MTSIERGGGVEIENCSSNNYICEKETYDLMNSTLETLSPNLSQILKTESWVGMGLRIQRINDTWSTRESTPHRKAPHGLECSAASRCEKEQHILLGNALRNVELLTGKILNFIFEVKEL